MLRVYRKNNAVPTAIKPAKKPIQTTVKKKKMIILKFKIVLKLVLILKCIYRHQLMNRLLQMLHQFNTKLKYFGLFRREKNNFFFKKKQPTTETPTPQPTPTPTPIVKPNPKLVRVCFKLLFNFYYNYIKQSISKKKKKLIDNRIATTHTKQQRPLRQITSIESRSLGSNLDCAFP